MDKALSLSTFYDSNIASEAPLDLSILDHCFQIEIEEGFHVET